MTSNKLKLISVFLPDINPECLSPYWTLDENSHMNVTLNISSQGKTCDFLFINHSWVQNSLKSIFSTNVKCSLISGQCKTYSFNITNNGDQWEVRMNETFAGIKLWIFPNDDCLKQFGLNLTGACHPTTDGVSSRFWFYCFLSPSLQQPSHTPHKNKCTFHQFVFFMTLTHPQHKVWMKFACSDVRGNAVQVNIEFLSLEEQIIEQ